MKKTFFLLAFFSLFSLSIVQAENINILLEQNVHEALLEVCGPYYIYDPSNNSKITSGLLSKRFIVRSTAEGLKWGEEFVGINQIRVIPRNKDTSVLLNGIQYDGAIAIYKIGDKLKIINEVDVESYLKSILTDHFSFPIESEAMNAVAIVERTWAYFQIQKNKNYFWHIDKTRIDYQGAALIIPDSAIVEAVDATKDLILVNSESNGPFAAVWNEHSAGKTAPYNMIFRQDLNAPKTGVRSPLASLDRKDTNWSYTVSKEKLASLTGMKQINQMQLFQDKSSGKVYGLRLKDKTTTRDLDFFALQAKLSKKVLPSNDFVIEAQDKGIRFKGFGKGHGVGLCLYSASQLAQNGEMAMKILSKFFPGTYIVNLTAYPLDLKPEKKSKK